MKKFEELSEYEQKKIIEQIEFQNFLEEVADLEYQAYVNGDSETAAELYFKLLKERDDVQQV